MATGARLCQIANNSQTAGDKLNRAIVLTTNARLRAAARLAGSGCQGVRRFAEPSSNGGAGGTAETGAIEGEGSEGVAGEDSVIDDSAFGDSVFDDTVFGGTVFGGTAFDDSVANDPVEGWAGPDGLVAGILSGGRGLPGTRSDTPQRGQRKCVPARWSGTIMACPAGHWARIGIDVCEFGEQQGALRATVSVSSAAEGASS